VAACQTTRELIWFQDLLVKMHFEAVGAVPLFYNNDAAVSLCRNHMITARLKHNGVLSKYVPDFVLGDQRL
jgi:hypothetical protein